MTNSVCKRKNNVCRKLTQKIRKRAIVTNYFCQRLKNSLRSNTSVAALTEQFSVSLTIIKPLIVKE